MNDRYAKEKGGKFILRIEDTDRTRSTPESETAIINSLKWLGLTWHEGPDIGGPNGPYRQSDRLDIYAHYIDILLDKGHAFYCFCSKETLDEMSTAQKAAKLPTRYDGRCAHLSCEDVSARLAAGIPSVVRLKIPKTGTCVFNDGLRGDISFEWKDIDSQIIKKSDGWPTYHAASVIDDHLMGVTDVIRGEEWIPSTPKHVLLYSYFAWDMPTFLHLPLLRNADRSKLSKRRNPTSITHYEKMGYLPEALSTFLLSFALKDVHDDDLTDPGAVDTGFDITSLSAAGPIFDVAKLDWLNARFIRESLDSASFEDTVKEWMGRDTFSNALTLAKNRITKLSDIPDLIGFLFKGHLHLSKDTLLDGKLDEAALSEALASVSLGFETIPWTRDTLEAVLRKTADIEGIPFKVLVRHLYIAFTGTPHSLPLFESLDLMGKDIALARLSAARATLVPVSKKRMDIKRADWV
jgi:glutamyl-tRNA synthetase